MMTVFPCDFGCLHYRLISDQGTGARACRAMVFLHGLGASWAQFGQFEGIFAGPRLFIDLPGHAGNFLDTQMRAGFAPFADLVIALCDHLQISNANFVGISMGSAIALHIAAKRPDLVGQLHVIRPAWLTEASPGNLAIIDHIGAWFEDHDADEVARLVEANPLYQEMREDVPLAASSIMAAVKRPNAKAHAPVLRTMVQDRPFRQLSELRVIETPAVVVGSNADALHPVALAQTTAHALPNARLVILPPRYLEPAAHQQALTDLIHQPRGVAA